MTQVSISGGTGGPSVPTAYQNSDKDSSTSKSAVENGQLIIRNQDEQKQDINELSRDTESTNNPLKQIFDKQKELDKIETVELIKDIAQQTKDVVNKYDRIQAQNDVDKNKDALSRLEAAKAYEKLTDDEKAKISFEKYYEDNKDYWYYSAVDTQLASNLKNGKNLGTMGGDVSKGIDSAVAIVTGIISGDITGGLAGASAPWLAEQIKKHTGHMDENGNWVTDNVAGNLITHAILGAVVAELQGNSGLVGGAGAVGGELAADIIRKQLYGKDVKDLTEEDKRTISALAQLATGLAIAVAGGDVGDAGTAIAAGKNAVENNGLTRGAIKGLEKGYESCMKIASCRNALMQLGLNFGLTNAQIEEAMRVGQTRDINQIKELTPEQIAWLDAQILAKKGLAPIMFGDETFGDRIYNESSGDNDSNNNKLGGAGAITAGGAPGLPPDDDHNNKDKSSASEDKSQTTSNGYKVSNGADKVIDKADLENPIVQSRINIQNGDSAKGWNHVLNRHFNSNSNASQFTISEAEAKSLIGSDQVRNVPISNTRFSIIKGTNTQQKIYERVITLDKNIGVDKFSGKPTNTITILTDKAGNLITATPGRIPL
ncbi:VENN motif pre-toxin domain-containing protein [Gilliamella sp. B2838]|uniref:VENN motif pre-toxin domain-containing protein n=1 Tax=Gilliamella sp. B2838 TaxID=2818020 RepID=UPI00226A6C22|nr:VENN motif pre-toxin domain-containing protein [Gilliamella sp. B2838]MCX8728670.1 VENN motif pre-toxin domain-containing protein [Gilliamella sp. B2838]